MFATALVLRVGAVLFTGPNAIRFGDAQDYLDAARIICEESRYPDHGNLPFFRAPALPFFIAAATACQPEKTWLAKSGLAVLDSATAVVVGEVAFLLFSSPPVALTAGVLAAADPFFILGVCDIRSEPLAMLFLTVAIWLLFRALQTRRWSLAFVSGCAFAFSALARPAGLVALAIAVAGIPFSGGGRAIRWLLFSAMSAGAFVTFLPWVTRNFIRYHEVILINDAGGLNFWRGSHPEMERISRISDPGDYRAAAKAFESVVTPAVAKEIEASATGPRERSSAWFAAGLRNVIHDPEAAVVFAVRRATRFWCPWVDPQEYPTGVVALSGVLNAALFCLGAIGLARHWKQDPFVAGWVIALFVSVWLAHVPFQVVMRFRISFTDPLLIVFSAGASAKILGAWRRGTASPPVLS